MKITQRIVSAALAGLMLLSLAGCIYPADGEATPTPGTEATPTPEPTATPAGGEETHDPSIPLNEDGTVALVETEDVVQKLLGFPRDTVLMTVNGVDVTAEDYLYCLSYSTENVCGILYTDMSQVDWDMQLAEGITLESYITDSAVETATFYAVIRAKAAAEKIEVGAEEAAELDAYIKEVIESLGGTEEYGLRLQLLGISDGGFRALNEVSILYDGLESKLFGAAEPTEEELIKFAEETADALMAKHILIKTVDDNKQPLPGEELAKAKALAEDILKQLRESSDPISLFDQLMNQYSEDGRDANGELYSKNGYLFGPNEMVAEFEDGTRALEYNEISGLVESEFGYHIILRLPPVNDEVRAAWKSEQMNNEVSKWVGAAQVDTEKKFSEITPKGYYEAIAAYREELAAQAEG